MRKSQESSLQRLSKGEGGMLWAQVPGAVAVAVAGKVAIAAVATAVLS